MLAKLDRVGSFPSQKRCEVCYGFVGPLVATWKYVVDSRTSTGTDISGVTNFFFAGVEVSIRSGCTSAVLAGSTIKSDTSTRGVLRVSNDQCGPSILHQASANQVQCYRWGVDSTTFCLARQARDGEDVGRRPLSRPSDTAGYWDPTPEAPIQPMTY